MQITAELLSQPNVSYLNAIGEFTLSLKNCSITFIENLELTSDKFECIDLSSNKLKYLDSVPKLCFLKTLILANNYISKIDTFKLPNLENLSLYQNDINSFSELYNLRNLKNLKYLIVDANPISKHRLYRLFLISIFPKLEVLDSQRIRQKEKAEAKEKIRNIAQFLKENDTSQLQSDNNNLQLRYNTSSTESLEIDVNVNNQTQNVVKMLSVEDKKKLKQQLLEATSLKEIQTIQTKLDSGYL